MPLEDVRIKKISLGDNKVYFEDGREQPLDQELKEMILDPEKVSRVQAQVDSERQFQGQVEKIPGGGETHAFIKAVGNSSLGNLFKNYATRPAVGAYEALKVQPGQEGKDFSGRWSDNINTFRRGEELYQPELKEKYPWSHRLGSLAGFGTDIIAASNVPGGPLSEGAALGFGAAPPIYEDPGAALKETAIGGAIGYGAGKVGEKVNRVASQRRASRNYREAMQRLPEEQRAAREAFRGTQRTKLSSGEKDLRHGVSKSSLENQSFINRVLNVSESAGSREASAVEKFITRLESGLPDKISGPEVTRLLDSVEGRIIRATHEEIPLLQAYKQHLVDQIPIGAGYSAVKEKLANQLVDKIRVGGGKLGEAVDRRVGRLINDMSPEEFYSSLVNGDLENTIRNELREGYKQFYGDRFRGKKSKKADYLRGVEERANNFADKNMDWLSQDLRAQAVEANDWANYTHKRVSSRVRNATGSPNPNSNIEPTNQLRMPPQPDQPIVGSTATRFEEEPFRPIEQLKEAGKQGLGLGILGKLTGLPTGTLGTARAAYGVGKVGLEGAQRFITAPTRVSEMTRGVIRRGGLPVLIEGISQTYPSYDKGILLDPMDRQDAVAEIENNPYIPLEEKAILQAKINRGRSLEDLKDYREMGR